MITSISRSGCKWNRRRHLHQVFATIDEVSGVVHGHFHHACLPFEGAEVGETVLDVVFGILEATGKRGSRKQHRGFFV
jgi:hypothetical protein